MPKNNLRIFIGPTDTARIGATLADAFRKRGLKVTVVSGELYYTQDGLKYDAVISRRGASIRRPRGMFQEIIKQLYHFLRFFCRHNTFIFISSNTLLQDNMDLPLLKLFGKKTIVWFMGSDIKHWESLEAAAKKAGLKYYASKVQGAGPEAFKQKLRRIRRLEKYVDYILTAPSDSQLITREYIRFCIPLDINNIRYNNTPNRIPIVVHAPTDDKVKGTPYVLEAVEQLKKEGYDFEFYLFRETSNTEVRETLTKADIAVDQLFGHSAGMFAVESMAAGCAVLGGNFPEFADVPRELPVIHTNPDNIYQNLKMLLENPQLRRELGEKGRKYVEKYHDSLKIADDFIKLLTTGKAERTYPAKQGT